MSDLYRVKLDSFEGPMDLLLYLIRKHEVDLHDIPLSLIADQYIGFLDDVDRIDIDLLEIFRLWRFGCRGAAGSEGEDLGVDVLGFLLDGFIEGEERVFAVEDLVDAGAEVGPGFGGAGFLNVDKCSVGGEAQFGGAVGGYFQPRAGAAKIFAGDGYGQVVAVAAGGGKTGLDLCGWYAVGFQQVRIGGV